MVQLMVSLRATMTHVLWSATALRPRCGSMPRFSRATVLQSRVWAFSYRPKDRPAWTWKPVVPRKYGLIHSTSTAVGGWESCTLRVRNLCIAFVPLVVMWAHSICLHEPFTRHDAMMVLPLLYGMWEILRSMYRHWMNTSCSLDLWLLELAYVNLKL